MRELFSIRRLHYYLNNTGIGRKNETDYNFCSSLSSYLGHPKPSLHNERKLFTIINVLRIEN